MINKTAKYALISVFDKTGIVEFAKTLTALDYKIISTGGTAKTLTENGVSIVPVQEVTGNPESFDGRMKTISFQIESGILFDRSKRSHIKEAKELNIKPIDIVVCNLYPFESTIAKQFVSLEEAIENIDVGGPTMIRAAGKNFKNVLVAVDPNDYSKIMEALSTNQTTDDLRQELASKAFYHLSFYDSQIGNYLNKSILFPKEITLPGRLSIDLRYGENPHQKGAVYLQPNTNSPFKNIKKLWGRGTSWMNIMDINAGLEVVRLFDKPAAVVIKHNSPCGIALGDNPKQALKRAIQGDPESAFGGIVVLNKSMNLQTAKVIAGFKEETKGNMDIVAIPEINEEALGFLKSVRKSMGIYIFGEIPKKRSDKFNLKWIDGGFILQEPNDNIDKSFSDWKTITKVKPTKKQLEQMQLAWKFITRIKSNSVIILDKAIPMTRGIGSGQTSRVRSTQIALAQAGELAKDGVMASDSFFPFGDSVIKGAEYGISAIVQQGGSINDQESIDAADKAGIAMILTGRRAFWH